MSQIDDLRDIAETLRGDGYTGDIPDSIDEAANTIEKLTNLVREVHDSAIHDELCSTQHPAHSQFCDCWLGEWRKRASVELEGGGDGEG